MGQGGIDKDLLDALRSAQAAWARGYFQGKKATDTQIDALLRHFKISNIVVGHTTHKQIEMHYDGKVIVIDANMKSGTMGEMLLWKKGVFVRRDLSGKELLLKSNQTKQ